MKTDYQLLKEFREKNNPGKLYTEQQLLLLMQKAREEAWGYVRTKIPNMLDLEKQFAQAYLKYESDTRLKMAYEKLKPREVAWAWFTNGAAEVIKKFKPEK